jgi:diguanylate cyclase (GGDEF)-like protein
MAVLVIFALSFLALGLGIVPSENLHLTVLITLLISQLILPYCYHNALSHRLHTRLIKLVRYDALTGLLNRRGIEESAIRELRRAQKYHQSFAMIYVNLKQFQEINQRYGFTAGDSALRKSARALKDIVSDSGVSIGRFTGNDFILLCSNTPMQQIRNMMLEIELAINALQIEHSDSSFHLNCIVHVVKAGTDGDTVYELFNSAQALMQKRKATAVPSKTAPAQQDVGALLSKIQTSNRISSNGNPEAA